MVGTVGITHPTVPGISTDVIQMTYSRAFVGTPRILVWSHGVNGDVDQVSVPGASAYNLWSQVVIASEGRYILVAVDDGQSNPPTITGNGAGLGNDAQVALTNTLIQWAWGQWPASKVAMCGHSGGAMTGMGWSYKSHIDETACFVYADGGLDMTYIRDNDVPSLAGPMDDAYSPSTWNTVKGAHDPVLIAGASPAIRAVPFLDFDATGDTFLSTTQNTNFVTAYGANCTRTTIGSGDHVTCQDFISPAQVLTFLDAADWSSSIYYPNMPVTMAPAMAMVRSGSW